MVPQEIIQRKDFFHANTESKYYELAHEIFSFTNYLLKMFEQDNN